jgi:hypothetical protein
MGRGAIGGDVVSSWKGVSITDANATHDRCRGVWVGTAADYDFSFDGSNWVLFKGCAAGTCLGIQVIGVRLNADSSAPAAGDIVFLY